MKSGLNIGVLGAGKFGQSFLRGLTLSDRFKKSRIWACARSDKHLRSLRALGIRADPNFQKFLKDAEVIVLSVKPHQAEEVLKALASSKNFSVKTLLISVVTGVTIRQLEVWTGQSRLAIVRAMPNTSCGIRQGATAICGGRFARPKHLKVAEHIFAELGVCFRIEEKFFDWVTALSGSGPAYFYSFIKVMTEVGVSAGFKREVARTLAAQTAMGAAMTVMNSDKDLDELVLEVATPGGCTAEALRSMQVDGTLESFGRGIEKAATKAQELGKRS